MKEKTEIFNQIAGHQLVGGSYRNRRLRIEWCRVQGTDVICNYCAVALCLLKLTCCTTLSCSGWRMSRGKRPSASRKRPWPVQQPVCCEHCLPAFFSLVGEAASPCASCCPWVCSLYTAPGAFHELLHHPHISLTKRHLSSVLPSPGRCAKFSHLEDNS